MELYEMHYSINGVKRWKVTSAHSKTHAIRKLRNQHSDRLVQIDAVIRLKRKNTNNYARA